MQNDCELLNNDIYDIPQHVLDDNFVPTYQNLADVILMHLFFMLNSILNFLRTKCRTACKIFVPCKARDYRFNVVHILFEVTVSSIKTIRIHRTIATSIIIQVSLYFMISCA